MVIVESELEQLEKDCEAELTVVNIHKSGLKEVLHQITTIKMTGRTEVTPATLFIPAVIDEDETTIITPAIPASPETSEQVFDVYPIDRNLGNIPMDEIRRQSIYDNIISKRASLRF